MKKKTQKARYEVGKRGRPPKVVLAAYGASNVAELRKMFPKKTVFEA